MKAAEKTRAVVIGSGPNGLTAAILLARAGRQVTVFEAADSIGGGARSAELTLPGFVHDVCSAVHPLAVASPCLEQFNLAGNGLNWVHPNAPVAHPLDDGSAVVLERSVDATCAGLREDGEAWRGLMEPFVENWDRLRHDLLAPLLRVPAHPMMMARFGMTGLRSARRVAHERFRGPRAPALFAGLAAHSALPLEAPGSAAFGMVLGIAAHAVGWPFPRGGAGNITAALQACLLGLGGEIRTSSPVETLPAATLLFCDVTPRQFLRMAGERIPEWRRGGLARYRHGPGAFKMDWALDGPIPWRSRDCLRAGTVHVGGTMEEIAEWERGFTGRPFVLVTQPSLFDLRAPPGKHVAWAYCHVPNGSSEDMSEAIEAQIERFAPGFRARILARSVRPPAALERDNPNLVGGDISGGANDLRQLILRPGAGLYGTPLDGVYLCSSSTPPGGGVHGMCGYHAVRAALGSRAVA